MLITITPNTQLKFNFCPTPSRPCPHASCPIIHCPTRYYTCVNVSIILVALKLIDVTTLLWH